MAVVVCVVGVAGGAVFWLTDPGRSSHARTHRAVALTGVRTAPTAPPPPATPEPGVPLFSENWIDDSGYEVAHTFAPPPRDPASLDELREDGTLRFRRGLADVTKQLAGLDRRTDAGKVQAFRLLVMKGLLHMAVGAFVEADGCFTEAQQSLPPTNRQLRANLDALRGMAALRRGESENCVSCCNSSSCIFPLAPEAFHANRRRAPPRRSGGSPPTWRSGPKTSASAGCSTSPT